MRSSLVGLAVLLVPAVVLGQNTTPKPTVDNIESVAPTNSFCKGTIYEANKKKPIWVGPTAKDGTKLFCTDSKTNTNKQCAATEACVVTRQSTDPDDQQQKFDCVTLPKCCPDKTKPECQPSTTTAKTTPKTTAKTTPTTKATTTPKPTTKKGLPFNPVYPTSKCCQWAIETPSQCDVNPTYMKLVCQQECGTSGCTPQTVFTSCPTKVNKQCGARKPKSTGSAATTPKPATGSGPAGPGSPGSGQPTIILLGLPDAGSPAGPSGPSGPGTPGTPGTPSGSSPGTQGFTITVERRPGGGDGSGAVGGVACSDEHGFCPTWSVAGECSANRGWMSLNCRRSCNTCASNAGAGVSGCRGDQHGFCGGWAAQNECTINSDWMNQNCNTSCGCPANPTGLKKAKRRRFAKLRAKKVQAARARRLRRRKLALARRKAIAARRRRLSARRAANKN